MLQEVGWPAVHHDEGAPVRTKNSLFTDYLPITLRCSSKQAGAYTISSECERNWRANAAALWLVPADDGLHCTAERQRKRPGRTRQLQINSRIEVQMAKQHEEKANLVRQALRPVGKVRTK